LDRPRFNFYAHDLLFVHEFSSWLHLRCWSYFV
jgi:hypothetical protein